MSHRYCVRYLDSRMDFCMFEALSLMAYIGSDRVCNFNCSIMLSKRRAIVEPRCLSGKCLNYHIEICVIQQTNKQTNKILEQKAT